MPRPSSPFMQATHASTPQSQIDEIKALALVLRLSYDDAVQRTKIFAQERRKPRSALLRILPQKGSRPTSLNAEISALCPTATRVRLYYHGSIAAAEPDRSIILRRIPSANGPAHDLWWPASSYIGKGFKAGRDGILLQWPSNTHYNETEIVPVYLSRCGGGSISGCTRAFADLSQDFELRRQLTFAILRKEVPSTRSKLYLTRGKIALDHDAPTFAALMQPLDFIAHNFRAQALPEGKAPQFLHAQIPGEDIFGYSGKVPWLVGIETRRPLIEEGPDLTILLKELLLSNLIPFVAVVREHDHPLYDLIQPEYEPSTGRSGFCIVKSYLRLPPTFVCERSPKGWLPNGPLAEALHAYMTHEALPGEYLAEHRRQLATRLLVTTFTPKRKGEPLALDEVLAFHGLGKEQFKSGSHTEPPH